MMRTASGTARRAGALLLLLALGAGGAPTPVAAADGDTELTFGYDHRGHYSRVRGDPSIESVTYSPDIDYFNAGQFGTGKVPGESFYMIVEMRPFFLFTLPRTPERITKAVLRIAVPPENYGSTDATETVSLQDITSDPDDVVAGGENTATVRAIWADLGGGVTYGTHVASAADDGTTITIPLNATFRALARNGGRIGIGGAITTLSARDVPGETIWGTTYNRFQSSLVLTIQGARPDAWVKSSDGPWAGDDVMNGSGKGQAARTSAKPGRRATYYVAIENAGRTADRWTVKGPGSTKHFAVRYFAGTKDVTARVVAGTHRTSRLPSGGFEQIEVRVTPKAQAPKGATLTQRIVIRSDTIDAWVDAVKVITKRS